MRRDEQTLALLALLVLSLLSLLALVRDITRSALWVFRAWGRLHRLHRRVSMARAVVSKQTERRDLTTLPSLVDGEEGGWVELRRLSYGEKLNKDAEAMKMRFAMGGNSAQNMDAELSLINEFVTYREFAK